MSKKLNIPENFSVQGKDGASLSEWEPVEGADGYHLQFFSADEPEKCIKSRYSQGCKKMILGFQNGKEYLVRVAAFQYIDNIEVKGGYTKKMSFVPVCNGLKAQGVVCLKVGETEQLVCEHPEKKMPVTYMSEDSQVASVSHEGMITAKAQGCGYIKITADDGQIFRTKVVVERSLSNGKRKAVLMLAGDLMCAVAHQRAAEKNGYDFFDAFSGIKNTLSQADYAVGVLETTCCDYAPYEHEQVRLKNGAPNCNSPSTFIAAIADAGFHGLVTANNHNCDTGKEGLEETVSVIRKYGMDNIGTLGDAPVVVDVNGIKVGMIACNMISNGSESEMGCDIHAITSMIGKYDENDFGKLVNDARNMGAEYVIAYQHWGKMNSPIIRKAQKEAAKRMAEAGVDMIVGSHPHVLQKFSYVKTKNGRSIPCAYSLGNFLTSMQEMRENRDSALLRIELSCENGKVDAGCSYIPCFSESRAYGVSVVPTFPYYSEICKDSFMRTKQAMGNDISYFPYKPSVMLSGSYILNRIFSTGKDFRIDKTAMNLSQLSLGSMQNFAFPENGGDRLALEISKNLAGYIMRTRPDFVAVDFYTAVTTSCYKKSDCENAEPCYFTNVECLRQSDFYHEHREKLIRVRAPFDESTWKPLIKRYAEILKKTVPHERILLFRCNISGKKFVKTELRNGRAVEWRNKLLYAMEEYFIRIVNPVVVDLARHYFTTTEGTLEFEKEYYIDAYKAALEMTSGKGRSCINTPDTDLWFDRVLKYYTNMTARAYQSWILDMDNAADKIIAQTSAEFAARNRERLIHIKKGGQVALGFLRDFFVGDAGAEDIIKAADIIISLEEGNLNKPYEFFAPAFDGRFNVLKTMSKLLAAEMGVACDERNVETLFLLRGNPKLQQYISSIHKRTVDIWGSCISREAVKRCHDVFVGKYIFKQAPVLAYESPVPVAFPEDAKAFGTNAWRRKTIQGSLLRNGFHSLMDSHSEWILVDFYDVICTMAEYEGELFETDDYIRGTAFYKNIENKCNECYLFEKRSLEYCFEKIVQFAKTLYKKYGNNIILIKAEPKSDYITLEHHLESFGDKEMVEIKKRFISLCEEYFVGVTDCYVIDISKYFYISDKFPYGGKHIVHYEDAFYSQTAVYLSEILNGCGQRLYNTTDEHYLLLRDLKLNR